MDWCTTDGERRKFERDFRTLAEGQDGLERALRAATGETLEWHCKQQAGWVTNVIEHARPDLPCITPIGEQWPATVAGGRVVGLDGVMTLGPGGSGWGERVLQCDVLVEKRGCVRKVLVLADRTWIYAEEMAEDRAWPVQAFKEVGQHVLVQWLDCPAPWLAPDMVTIYTRDRACRFLQL